MTIFDLPALDPTEAWAAARATLSAHPLLERFYDEPFIANLIRRRGAHDNVLLLRLVQPDDEMSAAYWNEVTDDLRTLEAEGAFEAFKAKLREHDGPSIESARTELFFAAWLKTHSVPIVLEPHVGTRRCEFMTQTAPETWWEIKSPLDLPELQQDAAVQMDVQRRLRTIDQPFILSLEDYDLTLESAPAAVEAIKREMYAYHRGGGRPPHVFASDGLIVSAVATTKRPKGYLGTLMGKPHVFRNENVAHVVKRLIAAAGQIPSQGGGIVVIDQSSSDWIDREDVEEACYGELQSVVQGGRLLDIRLPGAFEERSIARVSAVVSYTRRWRDDAGTLMTVMHNPSALIVLPKDFLDYEGVRHTRRVADGDRYRLATTPDGDD